MTKPKQKATKQAETALTVETRDLEPTKSQYIIEKFKGFFEQAQEWESKARTIKISSPSQVAEMKQAREARLELKEIRVNAEKTRKELKEQSLREGKAIDGVANVIKALIVPIEEYLEGQENFAERLVEEQKMRVLADRSVALQPYVQDLAMYNLKEMSEEGFQNLLKSSMIAWNAQRDAEVEAGKQRIAKEKEEAHSREAQRIENERLKKEAQEKDVIIAAEREKKEKAEAELAEKNRKELERIEGEMKVADARHVEKDQEADDDKREMIDWLENCYKEYVGSFEEGDFDHPTVFGFKEYLLSQIK